MSTSICVLLSLSIYVTVSMDNDCNGGACTPLTTEEKQAILDLHNELRDRVAGGGMYGEGHPKATDMNYLIWDEGLESVAQTYVETCPGLKHNPDPNWQIKYERDANPQHTKWGTRNGPTAPASLCQSPSWSSTDETCIQIGENLAVSGGSYDITDVLSQIETGWWDEYKHWTFGASGAGCPSGEMCGHYTQMAWGNTRYIGCGYANGCTINRWSAVFVCNYFPAGNYGGEPYASGGNSDQCTNCLPDRTECKSMYVSRSNTASSYPNQPYNALCGGGACPTMCPGNSFTSCNGCTPTPLNIDCNDGTIALDDGRDLCSWTRPPTAKPPPTLPPSPTGAPTPSPVVECGVSDSGVRISNLDRSGGKYNGEWIETGTSNSKPYYMKDVYYLDWILNRYWAMQNELGSSTLFAYCERPDLMTCTDGSWYHWDGDWTVDPDATLTECKSNATPEPTPNPTVKPTSKPTPKPTLKPTAKPTAKPTPKPTAKPTPNPIVTPTMKPTPQPTVKPTAKPTPIPTRKPTPNPTVKPSPKPTPKPTANPTFSPTTSPTDSPSRSPTVFGETLKPSKSPTAAPSLSPSISTDNPTSTPTYSPTSAPSRSPLNENETLNPTTKHPTESTVKPTPNLISYSNLHFICEYRDRSLTFYSFISLVQYAQIMVDSVLSVLDDTPVPDLYDQSWNQAQVTDFTICNVFSDITIDECPTYENGDENELYTAVGTFGIAADQSLDEYQHYIRYQMTSSFFYQAFTDAMNANVDAALEDGIRRRRNLLSNDHFEVVSIRIVDPRNTEEPESEDSVNVESEGDWKNMLLKPKNLMIAGGALLLVIVIIVSVVYVVRKKKKKNTKQRMTRIEMKHAVIECSDEDDVVEFGMTTQETEDGDNGLLGAALKAKPQAATSVDFEEELIVNYVVDEDENVKEEVKDTCTDCGEVKSGKLYESNETEGLFYCWECWEMYEDA
eukprot:132264_1